MDGYSTVTHNAMFWLDSKTEKKITKNIKYKFFYDASKTTIDTYWKRIILRMSKGSFPKWFSFYDGNLVYRHRKIHEQISITKLCPIICSVECIDFIRSKTSMMSKMDKMELDSARKKHTNIKTWKCVKSAKFRTSLINDFIKRTVRENNCNFREMKGLYSLLNISVELKHIGEEDIVIVDNRIDNIKGLFLSDDGFKITGTHEKQKQKPFIKSDIYMSPKHKRKNVKNVKNIVDLWKDNMIKMCDDIQDGTIIICENGNIPLILL